MSNRELERSIEAILMVVEEPVSEVVLAQLQQSRSLSHSMLLQPPMKSKQEASLSSRSPVGGAFIAILIWRH
jgi:chromosome segregation and condensation protein ScpB